MNAKQIWQTTIDRLRSEVNPQVFTTWFQGTTARTFQDGIFVICVSSTFAKAQLESRFLNLIRPILVDIIGSEVEIRVEVAKTQTDDARPRRAYRLAKGQEHTLPSRFGTPLRNKRAQETSLPLNTAQPAPQVNTFRRSQDDYNAVHTFKNPADSAPPYQPTAKRQFQAPKRMKEELPQDAQVSEMPQGETPRGSRHDGPGKLAASSQADSLARSKQAETIQEATQIAPHQTEPLRETRHIEPLPRKQEYSANTLHTPSEGLLNPRYTFSTFIVGKSNKLAHATSLAVAESPGRLYNPLFLYGGVGLGKTHLLHAIGHAGEAEGLYVLYTTSEKFTNEIVNAIRFQKTEEFRTKYRQIDILLIDDIQFIAGKESTEEEFFHTFNALHNANKQIVVTSDRPPKAISSLQDRLRSRFEWGLQADVRPPEYEHRLEILHSKCNSLRFTVPAAVIEYIARPECSSVRELEGALNRVIAYGTLHDAPLTIDLASQALAHIYDTKPPVASMLSINEVFNGVCRYYNINPEVLRGKQRDRDTVWPRQVAMYLMREEAAASWLQIGGVLGGRDHTTTMHGYEKVKAEIGNNEKAREEVAAVLASLRNPAF